jgi:tetratricopeptide (TPR) repeat protein
MTGYVAFLSYSHRDKAATEWLHRSLERFRMPKKLIGRETPKGLVPARLIPVFRDRDELAATDDLGTALRNALEASAHLIVVASPASAKSKYVEEEIRRFKSVKGEARVFALIVGGEPYASATPGREDEESFPRALRFKLGPDGQVSDVPAEPIAADIRPGKDGRRLALLKIIAGITGLRLDDLVQREAQRRARRLTWIASGASLGMLLTTGLAFYANQQRVVAVEQRRIAEKESAAARAATDYLIGTFELTNPATENPRTVSLLTILDRAAERARTELKAQPDIEARIVTAVGKAYNNLGLLDEAEVALVRAMPAIKRSGPDGAPALMALANTHMKKGELEKSLKILASAESMLGPDPTRLLTLRAQLHADRGQIAYVGSNPDQALKEYDEALRFLARDPGADPSQRALLLDGRGRVLNDLGRYDEAEASLQEANVLFRRYRGENHLLTGRNLYALALVAYSKGDNRLAGQRNRQSLAILTRMLDQTNPIRADALSLEGSIFYAEGRLDEAEKALVQSIDAYRNVYHGPHYNIGISEFYRAQIALDRKQPQLALDRLADAQRNYEASYGKVHANIGEVMVSRASILSQSGKKAEARRECDAGMAMLNETMGPENSFTKGLQKICDSIAKKGG